MNYCKNITHFITKSFIYMTSFVYEKEENNNNKIDLEENKFNKKRSNKEVIHKSKYLQPPISLKSKTTPTNNPIPKNRNKVLIELEDGTFCIGKQLFNDTNYYDKKEV